MKLISCYIENFGGLHQFSYDFTNGLNVIMGNNGWGKTTLAAFLKAMFYGLERSTKRSLDENERKKYEPWNGGAYGGNLVFEADGMVYRAERFFAGKDKEDTFVLYDVNTGLESKIYTDKLGEELFGIDKNAFEQSIYMKQGEYAVSMTDSVATKMSGLMASGDDMDCYEKACARLEEEMKIYKKIGNKGKIAEVTGEIAELNRRITEAKQTGATLDDWKAKVQQCYADTRELKTKKDDLKVQMRQAGEQAARQEKAKYYRALNEEKERIAQCKGALEKFFVNGIPTEEELEQYRNKLYEYRNSEVRIAKVNYGYKYPDLVKILERNPMTEEELDACEQKWNQVKEKENLLEKKELQLQSVRIREEEKNNYLDEKRDSYKVKQRISILVAVLSLVLAVVLYFMVGTYGLFVLGIPLIAVMFAIVFGMKAKSAYNDATDDNEELIQAEEEYELLSKMVENGKKSVRMYLQAFSIEREEEIPLLMNRIRITLLELNTQATRKEEIKREEEKKLKEKALLNEELILFFRRFYKDTTDVEEYLIKEIVQKRNEYISVCAQYAEKCRELEQTERIEVIPAEQFLSIEKLQQQEAELEREIQAKEEYFRQMSATVSKYAELMEECEKWEMEKADLEEVLAECQSKYKLLEKTLKYLKTAQNEFSSRYLKKINEGFTKYAKLINISRFEHSEVDLKLSVKTDEGGSKRDIAYFSKGMREAMELCVRFALIDALFEKETPFVVLDDPFVNLDQESLEGARKVLNEIAAKYQLIYFTCHTSRK